MRKYFVGSLTVFASMLVFSSTAPAQSALQSNTERGKADHTKSVPYDSHDFAGVWNAALYMRSKTEVQFGDGVVLKDGDVQPPFTPEGKRKYQANVNFVQGGGVLDCDPLGASRAVFSPRPMEFFHVRDRILQHFEYYDGWREIWMDRKPPNPDTLDPSYMGYSYGHWEGDTLVIDVLGYNGKTFLMSGGLPLSPAMHQTERWQRIDHDTLKVVVTFDDPRMYTKTWSDSFFYKLKPDWQLLAVPCVMDGVREWYDTIGKPEGMTGLSKGKPSDSSY